MTLFLSSFHRIRWFLGAELGTWHIENLKLPNGGKKCLQISSDARILLFVKERWWWETLRVSHFPLFVTSASEKGIFSPGTLFLHQGLGQRVRNLQQEWHGSWFCVSLCGSELGSWYLWTCSASSMWQPQVFFPTPHSVELAWDQFQN